MDLTGPRPPSSARRTTLRGLQAPSALGADPAALDRALLERMLHERRYADALELLHEARVRRPDDTSIIRAIEALERHVRGEETEEPRSVRPVSLPAELQANGEPDMPMTPPRSATSLAMPLPRKTVPGPPPPPMSDDVYAARFAAATEAYLAGDLARAARIYEECVMARPGDVVAAYNLSKLRARMAAG